MRNEDGSLAQNDKENMDVMHPRFGRVFNNKNDVGFAVLNLIPQREMMQYLDGDITWEKLKRTIANIKTHKAPDLNKVPPEAFTSMDDKHPHHATHGTRGEDTDKTIWSTLLSDTQHSYQVRKLDWT